MSTKTQAVRAGDVLLLGPFLIWAGAQARPLQPWARLALVLSGVGTIVYNGINLAEQSAKQVQEKV